MELVEFPGVTLKVIGVCLAPACNVLLGTMPLSNPEEREEVTNTVLRMIATQRKAEELCSMANLLFDPNSFDYFIVE